MSDTTKRREPHRELASKHAERRGVSVKTLDRWVEQGILPPPVRINNRKYFNADAKPRGDGDKAK